MSTDLETSNATDTPPAHVTERIAEYVEQSVSANTRRAYESDWQHFHAWCLDHDLEALPAGPETVAGYLSALASGEATDSGEPYTASTIRRRATSIRVVHRAQGVDDPTDSELVEKTWKGIRRDDDVQVGQNGAPALWSDQIAEMVAALDTDTPKGARDRALILLGFEGGMRRSELAALEVADVERRPDGIQVRIRKSKTDQAGKGRTVPIPSNPNGELCAVRALRQWMQIADLEDGPLFRSVDRWGNVKSGGISGTSVNRAVKSAAAAAGLDPDRISAHSLRRGFVSEARNQGVPDPAIQERTGHSRTMLDHYDDSTDGADFNVL